MRLSQRGRNEKSADAFREAFRHLTLALDRNQKDLSLYKILIFLAKDQENEFSDSFLPTKIVENEAQIPRSDIIYM